MIFLQLIQPFVVISQTSGSLQPSFKQDIILLRQAESAGATSNELSEPVALLNKALELNRLALDPSTDATQRAQLLPQVDQILADVYKQATQLTTVSALRTQYNALTMYVWGIVVAILGTIIYGFVLSLQEKYRIRRTLQMRVSRR